MITQPEFEELCKHFDIPEDTQRELEEFYDGFRFRVDGESQRFYNNESLINYLNQEDRNEAKFRSIAG
jgi:hypothetical protein